MVAAFPGLEARLMVGMEIHVELATKTKMFTSVPNVAHPDYHHSEPNSIIDPVVIGMPGVLPVINKAAVDMAIKVGLALGCKIASFTKWDRKSYYYPDLPKNYQISQYDLPICGEGAIEIPVNGEPDAPTRTIRILRAHLEEDAGKLAHEAPGGIAIDHSIVDLNRAGTPLLEIVTYPDFQTPDEAVMFGQILRDIVRHIGVSQGIMQMGHIRFEPNINVIITKDGQTYKTPIAEIKNLNSFKAVYGSIAYEYERQIDEWMQTGGVMGSRSKSTRGWDDVKMQTTLQRHKEDEDEYRYFPDPDLVPVTISEAHIDRLKAELPELPMIKRKRYAAELGLSDKQIDALLAEPATTTLFDAVLATGTSAKRATAILLNYAAKRANDLGITMDKLGITAQQIHDIAQLADEDKIGSTAAADLFNICCENPGDSAVELANDHKLIQVSDTGALDAMIDQVLSDPKSAKAVEDIKAGKDKAIGMLMGQIMKLSKGSANPKVVTEMIKSKLQG